MEECGAKEFHCTICADDDVPSPVITLDCSHSFHAHCIVDWFRCHHDTCPNCRSTQVNLHKARLTPHQRVSRMLHVQQLAPPVVRAHLKTYQRAATACKGVRKELRTFQQRHRDTLREHNRLRARYDRWTHKKEDLLTLLGRTVVPGVPLVEAVEYDSDEYRESEYEDE